MQHAKTTTVRVYVKKRKSPGRLVSYEPSPRNPVALTVPVTSNVYAEFVTFAPTPTRLVDGWTVNWGVDVPGESGNQHRDQSAKKCASGCVVAKKHAVFPPDSVELLDEKFIQRFR